MAVRELAVKFGTQGFTKAIAEMNKTAFAYDKALDSAQKSLKEAQSSIDRAAKGTLSNTIEKFERDRAKAAQTANRVIGNAYKELGVKSQESLETQRKQAVSAFEAIKNSGVASARDVAEAQKQLDKRLDSISAQLGEVESAAKSAGGGFTILKGAISGFLANAATRAFGGIINGILKIKSAIIQVGSTAERQAVAFKTFTGSAEAAAQVMRDVRQFAATTPFELPEVTEAAKQLLAVQIPTEELIPTIKRLGEIAAGADKPLSQLLFVYTQIKNQGRALGQDINQLLNAGLSMDDIAKALGRSAKELGEMKGSSKGLQLSFEEVKKVIESVTSEGGRFYGLMDELGDTTAVRLSNVNDAFTKVYTAIYNGISPAISAVLDTIIAILDPLGDNEALWTGINEQAQRFQGWIESNPQIIESAAEALETGLNVGLETAVDLARQLLEFLTKNPDAIVKTVRAVESLIKILKPILGILNLAIEGWAKIFDYVGRIANKIADLPGLIRASISAFMPGANLLFDLLDRMGAGTPPPQTADEAYEEARERARQMREQQSASPLPTPSPPPSSSSSQSLPPPPPASSQSAPSASVGDPNGDKSSRILWLANNLRREFNLSDEQIAGIIGNLSYESGGLVPNIHEGGRRGAPNAATGRGYGWAQWTGTRHRAFQNFASQWNIDPQSPEANWRFLKYELETYENRALQEIRKARTVADASNIFQRTFERAGIVNQPSRDQEAREAYRIIQQDVDTKLRARGSFSASSQGVARQELEQRRERERAIAEANRRAENAIRQQQRLEKDRLTQSQALELQRFDAGTATMPEFQRQARGFQRGELERRQRYVREILEIEQAIANIKREQQRESDGRDLQKELQFLESQRAALQETLQLEQQIAQARYRDEILQKQEALQQTVQGVAESLNEAQQYLLDDTPENRESAAVANLRDTFAGYREEITKAIKQTKELIQFKEDLGFATETEIEALSRLNSAYQRLEETERGASFRQQRGFEEERSRRQLSEEAALFGIESDLAQSRANIADAQGLNFEANMIREQNAILAENLRYRQQIVEIQQQYGGNLQMLAAAEELHNSRLQEINLQYESLGEAIGATIGGAINNFFQALIRGEDAFEAFLSSLLQGLAQIGSALIQSSLQSLFGSIFGGGSIFSGNQGLTVPGFQKGGTIMDIMNAIAVGMKKEGPQAVLVAASPGEEILSKATGEAPIYQSLKRQLGNNPLRQIFNMKFGGTIGDNLLDLVAVPALNINGTGSNNSSSNVFDNRQTNQTTVNINVTAANPSQFKRSERQLGKQAAEQVKRAAEGR